MGHGGKSHESHYVLLAGFLAALGMTHDFSELINHPMVAFPADVG
jgi:hypothetical protein